MKQINHHQSVVIFTHSFRILAAVMFLTTIGMSPASASPLDASWTQVGLMQADGNMFDGNCNLDLSGACTFNNGGDFWNAFPGANEILFITGDRQYWGHAFYDDVWNLIQAAASDQTPNLAWIEAGRDGISLGSIVGNILHRPSTGADPFVTLEGNHCEDLPGGLNCDEMLWGEQAFSLFPQHSQLLIAHGGVEVYARTTQPPPAPTASAGFDQVVGLNVDVTLDGSESMDSNGEITLFEWNVASRDGFFIQRYTGETVVVSGLSSGFYDVTLTVTDDDALIGTDSSVLAVSEAEFTLDEVAQIVSMAVDEAVAACEGAAAEIIIELEEVIDGLSGKVEQLESDILAIVFRGEPSEDTAVLIQVEVQRAIDFAIAAGGNAKRIKKAQKELNKGSKELDKGNFKKATKHYQRAKKEADRAL